MSIVPDLTEKKIAIVAGEVSGDKLGAGLIAKLKQHYPNAEFYGIGGQHMIAEGFDALFPMEKLSVMGLVEVLKHLPELLKLRKQLVAQLLSEPPDVFIGIDAPDFNFPVELKCKQAGIKTVHYVGPSVWAWRQNRVKKIARSTDLVLTLFPFEAQYYQSPVAYVGHSLADEVPLVIDVAHARQQLNLAADKPVVAFLPGSRQGEVSRCLPVMLAAIKLLQAAKPELAVLIPAADEKLCDLIKAQIDAQALQGVQVLLGQAQTILAASDVACVTCGTAALEAMLFKKPMVVIYKITRLSYWLITKLVKLSNYSLPNILAGHRLVPELIQEKATPEAICQKLLVRLEQPELNQPLLTTFTDLHQTLRQDASAKAALAVAALLANTPTV